MEFIIPEDFQPREFQDEAVEFIVNNKRVLIPLPTGTGKTYIMLRGAYKLGCETYVILCSGNALYTWKKNIAKHIPELLPHTAVVGKMSKEGRQALYNDPNIKVLIIKFKTFAYDATIMERSPDIVLGDECHKFLRNHRSPQYKSIEKLCRRADYAVFGSATPVSKGRQQYWPVLHIINRKKFSSYWKFVGEFLHINRGQFGMDILGPKNTLAFFDRVKTHIFKPSAPIKGLPPIVRSTLPVQMTSKQLRAYKIFADQMYIMLSSGEMLISNNILAQLMRLRQLLCCPAILDPALGLGAGIETVIDHMKEVENRKHCVWFSPFTAAMPFMENALRDIGYKNVIRFQGGMEVDELETAEVAFREDPDSIAICSIMYSQSFELETGNPAYFIGYDWDPYNNEQAEGRLRRMTTKREHVDSFYAHCLGTVDDRLLEVCGQKVSNTRVDMQNFQAIQKVFLT